MKNNLNIQSGNSSFLVMILVFAGLFFAATAGSYYFLKSQGLVKSPDSQTQVAVPQATTANLVSDSDEVSVVEEELEETVIGEIDSDLEALNSDAASL